MPEPSDDPGPRVRHRSDETRTERDTRRLEELLTETRVAAVGIQVILGFLLTVPFNVELHGLQLTSYVVAIIAGLTATVLLLAPSVAHRVLFGRGQPEWIVMVGSRLLLAGVAATGVSLVAAALLVGDRIFDSAWRLLPPVWAALVGLAAWVALPVGRRRRLPPDAADPPPVEDR